MDLISVLVFILFGLSGWALLAVIALQSRVAVLETQHTNLQATLNELCADVKKIVAKLGIS